MKGRFELAGEVGRYLYKQMDAEMSPSGSAVKSPRGEGSECSLSLCRDGRVLGVLEVSRSIGDGQYKRCGVISVPDIKRCQLTHNDR